MGNKQAHTNGYSKDVADGNDEEKLFGEENKIKGLARLINAEMNKKEAIEKDDHDHNKENMQLLKYMFKKLDPSVMATATYKNHGDVQLSFKYEATRELLLVKVIRCRDLQAKDLRGKNANAFVKLIFHHDAGDNECNTQVAKLSLNPEFHEIFTFTVTDDLLSTSKIVAQVWDKDTLTNDDFIGEAIVPLRSFDFHLEPTHTAWYNLKAETDMHITGELDVELQFKPPETLQVTVHSASNITNRHPDNKAPNPFVKLQIPGIAKCFQTKEAGMTVNPEWEETFEFEISSDDLSYRYVILHLVDKGNKRDSNDSLGQVIIDLCNFEPEIGFRNKLTLADMKNSERLRMRWFQQASVQEFREGLIAHAAFRYPKSMFKRTDNTKVLKLTNRKQGKSMHTARLRIINGIPVY